jgi:hypothetical protein
MRNSKFLGYMLLCLLACLLLLLLLLQDLGRNPEELLAKQLENEKHLEHRRDELNQAAPGQNLDEMAAAGEAM